MGKSLNNFITLKQAFSGAHERLTKKYDPLAIRQLILTSHYRSPLDFSGAALDAAQSGFDKISQAVTAVRKQMVQAMEGQVDEKVTAQLQQLKERFEVAMDDDLNTAIALSVIFELVRLAGSLLEDSSTTPATLKAVNELFSKLGGDVLGIVRESYGQGQADAAEKLVNNLIERRKQAREGKDFKTADVIRTIAVASDVIVMDNPDGTTTWRWK